MVTHGGVAESLTLRRNQLGQLGFHINVQGVVADVEVQGSAWQAGLRPGCRLVEICSVAVVTLSHEQLMELLSTSATVSAVVIPPHNDGTPRRSETFTSMFYVLKVLTVTGRRHLLHLDPGRHRTPDQLQYQSGEPVVTIDTWNQDLGFKNFRGGGGWNQIQAIRTLKGKARTRIQVSR